MYIGIDPGKSGAIALIKSDRSVKALLKMPDTLSDLWLLLPRDENDAFAVIEHVQATPRMGTPSAFTFGKGYGALLMALTGLYIPYEEVRPQKWMKEFGMRKGKDEPDKQWKGRLRDKAQKLFPRQEIPLQVADALLIAEYARRRACVDSMLFKETKRR